MRGINEVGRSDAYSYNTWFGFKSKDNDALRLGLCVPHTTENGVLQFIIIEQSVVSNLNYFDNYTSFLYLTSSPILAPLKFHLSSIMTQIPAYSSY